jgi:Asp-tRNA(Asn)/Glu-tRNA(Gln) amidotransferase A subunit family amidase
VQVPTSHIDGLPVGIQLIAPPQRDEALIRYAKSIEPKLTLGGFHSDAVAPSWLAAAVAGSSQSKM